MEGVSFVLRKNCDDIISKGTAIDCIIATGEGAIYANIMLQKGVIK